MYKILALFFAGLLFSDAILSASDKPSDIASETVAAYEQLGAKYLKIGRTDRAESSNALPLFEFGSASTARLKSISKLPKPSSPFGLTFSKADDAVIDRLLDLDNLVELRLMMSPGITDEGIKKIGKIKNLTHLTIHSGNHSVALSEVLPTMRHLVELDLHFEQIDEVAKCFFALPKLTRLSLVSTDLSDKGLKEIANVKSLKSLNIRLTSVTDDGIRSLRKLDGLTQLDVTCTRVTDGGLTALAPLKNLSDLQVLQWRGANGIVTDKCLEVLRKNQLLHALFLASNDAGSRPRKPSDVTSVDLYGTSVTDVGLKELRGFERLRGLNLFGLPITDRGLQELVVLEELTILNLGATEVTDNGLETLRKLKKLKRLNLSSTKVTPAGIKTLKESLPNCDVEWKE